MNANDPSLQTIAQLVKLTGKANATIKKRLMGLPPVSITPSKIIYDTRLALPIIYDVGQSEPNAINYNVEKARTEKNRADKLEMENSVRRGELVERSDVLGGLQNVFGAVRAKLLSLPTKAAPVVVTLGETTKVQSTLKKFVHDALDELSEDEIIDKSNV